MQFVASTSHVAAEPKSALPDSGSFLLHHPAFSVVPWDGITLLDAPTGYVPPDTLVSALVEHRRPVIWLCLDSDDVDPATFLISLIDAAQRLRPGVGSSTLDQMRSRPGPVFGWPPLFVHLAQEFAESLPANTAIVLERVDYLLSASLVLTLIRDSFSGALPSTMALVLIAEQQRTRVALPLQANYVGVDTLRIASPETLAQSVPFKSALSTASMSRAIALTQGRAVALMGLLSTENRLGARFVQEAIDRPEDWMICSLAWLSPGRHL
jgi:hypothetical protein